MCVNEGNDTLNTAIEIVDPESAESADGTLTEPTLFLPIPNTPTPDFGVTRPDHDIVQFYQDISQSTNQAEHLQIVNCYTTNCQCSSSYSVWEMSAGLLPRSVPDRAAFFLDLFKVPI